MSNPTFGQLITRVAEELSMTAGAGVQIYGEDRIALKLQRLFNSVFDEFWLDGYTDSDTFTLDGAAGLVTVDLTGVIDRLSDIQAIFREDSDRALTKLPTGINPYNIRGTVPAYFTSTANKAKVFKIFPITAEGNLNVLYRQRPADFAEDDVVLADGDLLVIGAVYDYLESDGTNPNDTQKFKAMFDAKITKLKALDTSHPITLHQRRRRPNTFTVAS